MPAASRQRPARAADGPRPNLAWWRRLSAGRRLALSAGALVVVAAVTLPFLLGSGSSVPQGQYLSFTACLLTDSHGLADPSAAAAWAGLQKASAATRLQAQYLAVPQTAHDAGPYLATLVVQRCGVVVTVGVRQAAAVAADASRYSKVKFVVIGGSASGPNITVIKGKPSALRSQVVAAAKSDLAAAG